MSDPKTNVRYLGFHALTNGGRRFDFSFALPDRSLKTVSIEASNDLFSGPGQMAIQECAGVCYETVKSRVANSTDSFPASIKLTAADVALHRKPGKQAGSRK